MNSDLEILRGYVIHRFFFSYEVDANLGRRCDVHDMRWTAYVLRSVPMNFRSLVRSIFRLVIYSFFVADTTSYHSCIGLLSAACLSLVLTLYQHYLSVLLLHVLRTTTLS